ncbi:hypothetical protein DBR47_21745 [Paucibacter sp. KBW04]|nr:hypothetical protein DBR47_21745 [Paucibacter sp. KBW04]
MRSFSKQACVGLVFSALLLACGLARAATPLPTLQHSAGIEYLSGGIGSDEAKAIQAAAPHWPLTLEFAIKGKPRDEFAAHVGLQLRDAKGGLLLKTYAEGPFFLARLPAGRYEVEAQFAGQTLRKRVDVKQGQAARALFLWPQGAGESSPQGRHE